jgi:hypothetical protein
MPVQTTSGSLTYPKTPFVNTPTSGNGWIAVGPGGYPIKGGSPILGYASLDSGTGISLDANNNMHFILATSKNVSTQSSFFVKLDGNTGNNIWYGTGGLGICASSSNVILPSFAESSVNGSPRWSSLADGINISNTANNYIRYYEQNLAEAYNYPQFYGVQTDGNNVISLYQRGPFGGAGRLFVSDANCAYVANGGVFGTGGTSPRFQSEALAISPDGNTLYAAGFFCHIGNTIAIPCGYHIIKMTKTSNLTYTQSWAKRADANTTIYFIGCDNSNVVVSTNKGIAKLDSNGNIIVQKNTAIAVPVTIDSDGNIYSCRAQGWIKMDSNLTPIFYNYHNIINGIGTGNSSGNYTLGINVVGNHVYVASVQKLQTIAYKMPKDGFIPDDGKYKVGAYFVTFNQDSNLISSNTSMTFTSSNNISSGINPITSASPTLDVVTPLSNSNLYYSTTV